MKNARFWAVVVVLASALVLLRARPNTDRNPPREPLSQFPVTVGAWSGTDFAIDQESLNVLGPGDFLSRMYSAPSQPSIGLFIGYFPSQRTGTTIHSPKHCLPGSGWTFESSRTTELTDAAGKTHKVGEYVIANGDARKFVVYWYEAHGRSLAGEYEAKFYLVADAMRLNRTDGALVRVMTAIEPSEGISAAQSRVETFARETAPSLTRFIPD
jgi:EpsI family protein